MSSTSQEARVTVLKWIVALSLAGLAIASLIYVMRDWNNPMTGEQIVAAVKYCKDHGMKPEIFTEPFNDGEIHAIQCFPSEASNER